MKPILSASTKEIFPNGNGSYVLLVIVNKTKPVPIVSITIEKEVANYIVHLIQADQDKPTLKRSR